MSHEKSEAGPFAVIFAVIGFIAGISSSAEADAGGGAIFFTGVIMAFMGFAIGRFVDKVVAWVLFIVASVIMILVNTAIRQFLWKLVMAIFGSD